MKITIRFWKTGDSKGDRAGTGGGQDKNKGREENQGNSPEAVKAEFERFRKLYPGTKMGADTEFENFKRKNPDYSTVVFLLYPALEALLEWRKRRKSAGRFVPEMANLQTWINQKRWEIELENTDESNEYESKQKTIGYYAFD
jgi:hypothetical protein